MRPAIQAVKAAARLLRLERPAASPRRCERKGVLHLGRDPWYASRFDEPLAAKEVDRCQFPSRSSTAADACSFTPVTVAASVAPSLVMSSASSPASPRGLHVLSGLPGAPVCVWLSSPQPSPGRSSLVTRAGGVTRSSLSSSPRLTFLLLSSLS